MRVEQFAVVEKIGIEIAEADFDVAVGQLADWHRVVSDVVEERVASTRSEVRFHLSLGNADELQWIIRRARRQRAWQRQHHDLRKAGDRIGNEIAIRIGRKQREVADVIVGEINAQDSARLLLDLAPRRQAAIGAVEQFARRVRPAVCTERILAQEHLVRWVRGVGLVLIDERRRDVDRLHIVRGAPKAVLAGARRCAGQNHEVGVAVGIVERIVR